MALNQIGRHKLFKQPCDYFMGKELEVTVQSGKQVTPPAVWEHCEGYIILAKVVVERCSEAECETMMFTIDHESDLREVFDDDPDQVFVSGESECRMDALQDRGTLIRINCAAASGETEMNAGSISLVDKNCVVLSIQSTVG